MRISAKADYAVRATAELAAAGPGEAVAAENLAAAQQIPHRFLEGILGALRRDGIVASQRGPRGGYRLARRAGDITVADVIRAVDGPLVFVRGERPPQMEYVGAGADLPAVWVALRANVRAVLEAVTVADLGAHTMPDVVRTLTRDESAWSNP